jgi:hypothetical protein
MGAGLSGLSIISGSVDFAGFGGFAGFGVFAGFDGFGGTIGFSGPSSRSISFSTSGNPWHPLLIPDPARETIGF